MKVPATFAATLSRTLQLDNLRVDGEPEVLWGPQLGLATASVELDVQLIIGHGSAGPRLPTPYVDLSM